MSRTSLSFRWSVSTFCAFTMATLTACNPKYYSPNTQNVPLISAKHDLSLAGAGNSNEVEAQAAYGVTDNVAIKAEGGAFIPRDADNGNGGSGRFVDLGAGFYRLMHKRFIIESYGIIGIGSLENHLPSTIDDNPGTSGDLSATVLRYGIQPSVGYRSKYYSAALSSRIVGLRYQNIDGDLIFEDEDQVEYLKDKRSQFLIEPALTLRGGLEKVKLQVQIGHSFNVGNSDFRQDKGYLTLGVHYGAAL